MTYSVEFKRNILRILEYLNEGYRLIDCYRILLDEGSISMSLQTFRRYYKNLLQSQKACIEIESLPLSSSKSVALSLSQVALPEKSDNKIPVGWIATLPTPDDAPNPDIPASKVFDYNNKPKP